MRTENQTRFLALYGKLEEYLKEAHGEGKFKDDLLPRAGFRKYSPDWNKLSAIHEVRNLLSHNNQYEIDVAIGESWLHFLAQQVSKFSTQRFAGQVAIRKVFTSKWDEPVHGVMRQMIANEYSHVPVLGDRGQVEAVFSEDSLARKALRDIGIDESTTLEELRDFCDVVADSAHRSETFKFVSERSPIHSLLSEFRTALGSRKRLSLLFVTTNGKSHEPMIGILTIWDVIALFAEQ